MIPNTKDTIRRIRKSSASSTPVTIDDHTEPTSDKQVFMSSKFRNMYVNTRDNTLDYQMGDATRKEDTYKYTYPFESEITVNALPKTFDATVFYSKLCTIHICIYRVCKGGHTFPYLQFKLKCDSKKEQLVFPSFSFQFNSSSDSDRDRCVKKANEYISQLFKGNGALDSIEFRGAYHYQTKAAVSEMHGGKRRKRLERPIEPELESKSMSSSDSDSSDFEVDVDVDVDESLYMVYEDVTHDDDDEDTAPSRVSYKSEWWWACVHEVYNTRRILLHRIGRNVTALFESEPSALFLMNDVGNVYETPHVLYKGRPAEVSLDEMRAFGPRKCVDDNNVSSSRDRFHAAKNINEILMHGSHYYLYEFCDALRGACYTYDDAKNAYKKMQTGPCCVFRYIVFLGNTKTIMFDASGRTNHDRIDRAHMYRDREWPMRGYNSIYHGKYRTQESTTTAVGGRRRRGGTLLYPAFSVADVNRIIGASYHEVDATTIPDDINSILKGKKLVKFK